MSIVEQLRRLENMGVACRQSEDALMAAARDVADRFGLNPPSSREDALALARMVAPKGDPVP